MRIVSACIRVGVLTLLVIIPVYAESIVFPADAGVVDVTKPPYNADRTGSTDATRAVNDAMLANVSSNTIIYLPNGTYLVSDTINWPRRFTDPGKTTTDWGSLMKRTILQGQSRDSTIIRLADNALGFADTSKPRPMIYTGPRPAQRFRNAIRNLTVDAGSGNPGAVGIQFHANNQGCVRDVKIVASPGSGFIGLDMSFTAEIGPCLIKNLSVDGFGVGIKTAWLMNGMTFEHIRLSGQRQFGMLNDGNLLSIRDLISNNEVPALNSRDTAGHVVLIDAHLTGAGSASGVPALLNNGVLLARGVVTSGYQKAIVNQWGGAPDAAGPIVAEFVSHAVDTLFASPTTTLGLAVKETPDVSWDAPSDWESVRKHGADSLGTVDATQAIQNAVNAGKSTVYFPRGKYKIDGTVSLGGKVRRVIGCEAEIVGTGAIHVVSGDAPVVVIERFELGYSSVEIVQVSTRALVISSCITRAVVGTVPGDIYLEDVCGGPYVFKNQNVWARQFNCETDTAVKITNDGGKLWILGLKTEKSGTAVLTRNGGASEILGGELYPSSLVPPEAAFINDNSRMSVSISATLYKGYYNTIVQEIRSGQTRAIRKENLPRRMASAESPDSVKNIGAFMLPLYVGDPDRSPGAAGQWRGIDLVRRPGVGYSLRVLPGFRAATTQESRTGETIFDARGRFVIPVFGCSGANGLHQYGPAEVQVVRIRNSAVKH